MSSILDINPGSSDSEDDQDYVPPNASVSDESDDEISAEENEFSEASIPKKIKLNEKEPNIDKTAADSIWKNFLKGVDDVGRRKAISSGSNVSNQCKSDSSDLCTAQGKTADLEKSTCGITVPEKEICSEKNSLKDENIADDLSKEKKDIISEKIAPFDNTDVETDRSCKTKPIQEQVNVNAAKKSGISSILGAIANKDKKMTVLEKSQLDWKNYKKEEGIEEDLQNFNRGRQGYVERMRFLERSDLRLFETEKSARLSYRKK